ncbi:MAG: ATP-dependent DNA ligase [Candidatus Helarchaeota archaeon]
MIKNFLLKLDKNEIKNFILLLNGRISIDKTNKPLNLSYNSIVNLLTQFKDQKVLFKKEIYINDIYSSLHQISEISGKDSVKEKKKLLLSLFSQLSEVEKRYLFNIITGNLRLGASEGIILQAIAKASKIDYDFLRNSYMISGNIGEIGFKAINEGINAIKKIQIQVFTPVRPMLARISTSIQEILQKHTNQTIFEYKYDGIRIQLHKNGNKIKLYTRKLNDITNSFKNLISNLQHLIDAKTVILDGELIKVDKLNRPFSFQDIIKKNLKSSSENYAYKIIFFDILYLNGNPLIDLPLIERKNKLNEISRGLEMASSIIETDLNSIDNFFQKSISSGNEGIIAKKINSKYYLGTRNNEWLKFKKEYSLDLVIIAADWGSGRRYKWLSNYHLAVKDQKSFKMVGKTFKGLTDKEFDELTNKLLNLKIKQIKNTVFVRPEIVVEVIFNEIQKSSKYKCGYALRFARIKNIRNDKSVNKISSLKDIKELYNFQAEKKAKFKS